MVDEKEDNKDNVDGKEDGKDGHKNDKKDKDSDEDNDLDINEELFDINNTIIDFKSIIIGEKLKAIREGVPHKYVFNDYTLSEFVYGMKANSNVFSQASIMKIIDYQWERTKVATNIKFYVFLILYYIPFLISITFDGGNKPAEASIMILCLII